MWCRVWHTRTSPYAQRVLAASPSTQWWMFWMVGRAHASVQKDKFRCFPQSGLAKLLYRRRHICVSYRWPIRSASTPFSLLVTMSSSRTFANAVWHNLCFDSCICRTGSVWLVDCVVQESTSGRWWGEGERGSCPTLARCLHRKAFFEGGAVVVFLVVKLVALKNTELV